VINISLYGPVVQLVRTPACHAGGRQFEPVPGRHISSIEEIYADIAQSVERILGKDEVASSNLAISSKHAKSFDLACFFFVKKRNGSGTA
jgi:hypothetical protein